MAFNVDHLLNTNSTPSQEQRDNLRNFILQLDEAILNTDEDISGINEQILAMQAKILVLQTRRTQLVQQRRCYSSLLSPIRCLPIEIFGQIFDYATHDRPRHVLNLSAVCQSWRAAALRTPILWSTLELGHHTRRRNMNNHINSWIERARSYPLSLVIQFGEEDNFLDPLYSVLNLITKYQWKLITLDSGDTDSGDTTILSILKELEFSNLEVLESFSLALRFYYPKLLPSPPDALRYAPKLKTLSLKISHPAPFDTLPFPWRQLTSLTIAFWDPSNVNIGVDILRACENLEEFIISGNCDGSGSNDFESVTLNHLRKLHTRCIANTFLLSLKTPSMQDFAVKASTVKYRSDCDFYNYIGKNGSTLLNLSIAPCHGRLVESIPYLRSLVELKLYDNDYDNDGSIKIYKILSSLVVNPEMDRSTIPLPRLEALEIIYQATEENQRMFMKVIDSRWWSDEEENARQKQGRRSLSRIKRSVLMNVHTELNVFCRDHVDVLRAQGMSIEYLALFDGMDKDDFYTSRYYTYPPSLHYK